MGVISIKGKNLWLDGERMGEIVEYVFMVVAPDGTPMKLRAQPNTEFKLEEATSE